MPIDYSEYPENWKALSASIRTDRAKNRCECDGKCGHHHPSGRCDAINHKPHPITGSRVVLTVAHYPDPTKSNVDPDNLHALCQRCHLALDMDHHVRNRKYGRHHNGEHQLRLFA